MKLEPMAHQRAFAERWAATGRLLNFSGCGTGKTASCILTIEQYWPGARVLVLGPLSILKPAWGGDLDRFVPGSRWEIAYAKNREQVMTSSEAQWVITNHDAIKQIADNNWHTQFDVLVVDEADAFRNKDSLRSKALAKVTAEVPYVTLMTGTPTPKSVLDVWHLAFCVDRGERLGKNYFGFRANVCSPKQVTNTIVKWVDKPQANDIVTALLSDVTFRVNLDDVTEMPPLVTRTVQVDIPPKLLKMYRQMQYDSLLELENKEVVNAVHAGARLQKLLQILSGAVYDENGAVKDLHKERHELVLDLALEAEASLVAFQWEHQRKGLEAEAKKRGIDYGIIDGSTAIKDRERLVEQFQAGKLQVLFAHPQSAGHGLTLTMGTRLVWASPTHRADLYEQMVHRIYRKGQTRRCEVIHVAADGTAEEEVYIKVAEKRGRMEDLLALVCQLQELAA
ncbi:SNF2 family DNA or RNA helicase [Oceanisphaera litoralis]|uniref:SNF2-related protein n=1 Tax=Oceanisphaera litoralis TaxID=225144 RepID=UPI00195F021F|nr:DEAD/DEAH box helicase [Oceanisphaera litoralis]MBM7454514.1 SNF2 family DNA or RNA helicase [Oceanisphaera litoralis]